MAAANKTHPLIQIQQLSKRYARSAEYALRDVSVNVYPGDYVGLIGANGSGKTTLIKLVVNFLRPTSGQILIEGTSNLEAEKRRLGYVPEIQEGLENFTPQELLTLAGRLSGLSAHQAWRRCQELLAFIGLEDQKEELLAGFSKGMIQRVQLGIALVHQPDILLLDEPLSGLDPDGQRQMLNLLQALPARAMLYASHRLEAVEQLCNRVLVLRNGQLAAEIGGEDLKKSIFLLQAPLQAAQVLKGFAQLKWEIAPRSEQEAEFQLLSDGEAFQTVLATLKEQGIPVRRIRSRSILEHYYLKYVQQ